jgi:hypothetical protein
VASRTKTTTKKAGARRAAAPTKASNGGSRTTAATPARTKEQATLAAPSTNGTVLNQSGKPRLGKGGLEAEVSAHLAAHPKAEFTPTELSHKLGRSGGAIYNALEKFVREGKAKRTSERPRRYRHAGAKASRRTSAKRR